MWLFSDVLPPCTLTQGPSLPASSYVSMCLKPGRTQKSCSPSRGPQALGESMEITAGMRFSPASPATAFRPPSEPTETWLSAAIAVCWFVNGFLVSESPHSQGHRGSQSGYQTPGMSHAAREVLLIGGNAGLGRPEARQWRIKPW